MSNMNTSLLLTTLLAVIVLGLTPAAGHTIKHVILVMEENRSFDHMMGFYKRDQVDGLTGNETNPINTEDPNSKLIRVNNTSPYIGPFDPNHSVPPTTEKIFGNKCLNTAGCNTPTMCGFVEYEAKHHSDPSSVMNMFTPDRVPIMSTLADEFLLFDKFYASVPGPTWPNRLFQLMATSEGDTKTTVWNPNTTLYTSKTVFDSVEEAGRDWKFYYADAPLEMAMIEKLTFNPQNIHGWKTFKSDIKTGNLPAFSWVNPRWFVNLTSLEGANDQHPDHDVRLGEALLKEVYEEIRASPAWNDTLLIWTYDEHGGFYDHVPPPMNVPIPEKSSPSYPDKFAFDRLGIRVPVLLISPWISKGVVAHEPHNGPFPDSQYDHTSVIATVRKIFNVSKPLTKRDAWAATFDHFLSESSPRTDCPMHLPPAPKSLGFGAAMAEASLPITDLQAEIIQAFVNLRGPDSELTQPQALPKLQGEGSVWMEHIVGDIMKGLHVHNNNQDVQPETAQA